MARAGLFMTTPAARLVAVLCVCAACAVVPSVALGGSSSVRPLALVYSGPAGCDGCSSAVAALIRRSPRHFIVRYIGPRQKLKLTAANLHGATLYAQPGGNGSVGHAMRVIGQGAARAIKQYVAGGGHYIGFCMGAYMAGSDPGLGLLLPGNTDEFDRTRDASVTTMRQKVIPVRWGHVIRYQYAQDPPYIVASHVPGERVLARFTNGRIDALVRPYHKGAVGVVGTHPEANRSWFTRRMWQRLRLDQGHSTGRPTLAYAQGLQLLAALMKL